MLRNGRLEEATACVLGEIDLVRALAVGGIRSTVVARAGDFARYSRFTTSAIDPADVSVPPGDLLARLLSHGRSCRVKPVLYYDGDTALLFVSRNRAALGEAFHLVVPAPELVEDLVDKARFQRLATRLGLPVPPAATISSSEGIDGIPERFPVIVKPVPNRTAGWSSVSPSKAIHIDTPEALVTLAGRLREAGVDALAQYEIPGHERLIESYHAYVGEGGEILAEFTGRKIRTYPVNYGFSTAIEIVHLPDVVEAGRAIMTTLAFTGVVKIDFKRDAVDGTLFLLEINARYNLWHYPGAVAGVNLPALVHDHLREGRAPVPTRARDGVTWCNPIHDWRAVRAEGGSIVRWIPWLFTADTKHAFAWDDPAPLFRAVAHRVGARSRAVRRSQRDRGTA